MSSERGLISLSLRVGQQAARLVGPTFFMNDGPGAEGYLGGSLTLSFHSEGLNFVWIVNARADLSARFSSSSLLVRSSNTLRLSILYSDTLIISLVLICSHFAAELYAGAWRVLSGAPSLIEKGTAMGMEFPRRTILAKGQDWRDEP